MNVHKKASFNNKQFLLFKVFIVKHFKTETLRLVNNVQLVKCLLLYVREIGERKFVKLNK